jgi:hypothetical protein
MALGYFCQSCHWLTRSFGIFHGEAFGVLIPVWMAKPDFSLTLCQEKPFRPAAVSVKDGKLKVCRKFGLP